jgi:hypothetical protein
MEAFPRSLDAACLFREFRRQGISYRASLDAVEALLGVGKSGVEKYLASPIEPIDEASDALMARFVLARYWFGFIEPRLHCVTDEARRVVDALRAAPSAGT